MTSPRTVPRMRGPVLLGMTATVLALGGACRSARPIPPVPQLPASPLAEPVVTVTRSSSARSAADSVAAEPRVTLTGEWSLRQALEEIGKAGHLSLIVSPEIADKKYRISLIDVPVSIALQSLLQAAGLSLEQDTGIKLSWNPTVVFYQLPVNVDSMSVESIMKRFNVSRDIAELIVSSRRP